MKAYKMSAFPKELAVRDGNKVTVRPLAPTDRDALLQFFLGLPEVDRQFLKDDVTSPRVVESWTANVDFDRVLPLVAIIGDRIVADAALLRKRHGAYRAVGTVRVSVAPDCRGQGIGTALLRELCDIAADAELEKKSPLSSSPTSKATPSTRPSASASSAQPSCTNCSAIRAAGRTILCSSCCRSASGTSGRSSDRSRVL